MFELKVNFIALVVYFLCCAGHVSATLYNRTNNSLTDFPDNIPTNVLAIDLSINLMTDVHVQPLPNVVNVTLDFNRLVAFPNLSNISTTLQVLEMNSNSIAVIQADLLDQLVKLRLLSLNYNPLPTIPDVAGPSGTLYHLGIGGTSLPGFPELPTLGKKLSSIYGFGNPQWESITVEQLALYPALEYILMYGTGVKSVPNMCRLNRPRAIQLDVTNMVLNCDNDLLWLKIAVATGHVQLRGTFPSCSAGSGHPTTAWNNIDTKSLSTAETNQELFAKLEEPAKMYCDLTIGGEIPVPSKSACAVHCLRSDDCVLFSFQSGNCVLTSLNAGAPVNYLTYEPWYVVK